MKMAELASLLLFALNTKKSYQIGTKNKILFYGIFRKYLAFFKQNRKDSHVFVMI